MEYLYDCLDELNGNTDLPVRMMDWPSTEAEKVGSRPTLTWKMEVSYPVDDPRHHIPPSDKEVMPIAKMIFPNRPECHKLF